MARLAARQPTIDVQPATLEMSYEDFLAWADEGVHAEWVPLADSENGAVIVQMPPKLIHHKVVKFLSKLLDLFVHLFDLGDVEFAPFEVKLQPGRSSREPDIFFVAKERLDRLTQDRMNGPPDLIVEVVSEDSVKRDRSDKYREYQAAGVREYWVIDPRKEQQRADFFYLDDAAGATGQSEYSLFATEEDERVESHVLPGFWLRPEWLWQTDTRDPLLTFCEMAGLPEAVVNQFRKQMRSGFNR